MGALLLSLGASVVTAVPLFVASLRQSAAGAPLVWAHVGCSIAFFAVLGLKFAQLGARARPAQARRVWGSLVAHVGSALSAYTVLTGVLLFFSAAWADQHLAASFWMLAAVGLHARRYRHRTVALLAGVVGQAKHAGWPTAGRRSPAVRPSSSVEHVVRAEPAKPAPDSTATEAARPPPAAGATPFPCRPGGTRRRRLVVVGTGLAGVAVVEEALRRRPAENWEITMLGEEPGQPYNRILLSGLLAGTCDRRQVEPRPASWFAANGIDVRAGLPAAAVRPDRRAVLDSGGGPHPYDALVLATGSRPAVPPIPGVEADHVFTFRTREDVDRIGAVLAAGTSAVVVGGGLLGLEAAAGLMARGAEVCVIEAADRLMPQQLDAGAAATLERSLAGMGLSTLVGRSVGSIEPHSVRLDDGRDVAADVVVVAAGIRPEVSLALEAGIETARGVLVDDEMATSAPGVWAVGECAEHRGAIYGLWPPLLEQAQVAAASLSGSPSAFRGAATSATLKVSGVSVFAGGARRAGPGEREVAWTDPGRGSYAKVILRGDHPQGALAVGDEDVAEQFARLLADDAPAPALLAALSPPGVAVAASPVEPAVAPAPASAEAPPGALGDMEIVCLCRQVRRGQIVDAVRQGGLTTCAEVERATGASGGCGSCRRQVEALITMTAEPRAGAERTARRAADPEGVLARQERARR